MLFTLYYFIFAILLVTQSVWAGENVAFMDQVRAQLSETPVENNTMHCQAFQFDYTPSAIPVPIPTTGTYNGLKFSQLCFLTLTFSSMRHHTVVLVAWHIHDGVRLLKVNARWQSLTLDDLQSKPHRSILHTSLYIVSAHVIKMRSGLTGNVKGPFCFPW